LYATQLNVDVLVAQLKRLVLNKVNEKLTH